MQTGSSGTLIGWKSGQTTFVPLWDRMERAWLWTLHSREANSISGGIWIWLSPLTHRKRQDILSLSFSLYRIFYIAHNGSKGPQLYLLVRKRNSVVNCRRIKAHIRSKFPCCASCGNAHSGTSCGLAHLWHYTWTIASTNNNKFRRINMLHMGTSSYKVKEWKFSEKKFSPSMVTVTI